MSKEFNEWFKSQQGTPYYSYWDFAKAAWDYQQAKIDALMQGSFGSDEPHLLEYCPEEMTEDQLEEWKKSQKVFEG